MSAEVRPPARYSVEHDATASPTRRPWVVLDRHDGDVICVHRTWDAAYRCARSRVHIDATRARAGMPPKHWALP